MIFIASLWSNQPINASNFEIGPKKARLDWNWANFENLIFMKKSNLIIIDYWSNLSQNNAKTFQHIYLMHTNHKRTKKLAQKPYSQNSKIVFLKQLAILVPARFNWFWGSKHVPWYPRSDSRYLHCQKTSRIKKYDFGLFLLFPNSISVFHAFLTYLVVVFVISRKIASDLGYLIEFPWPRTHITIVRFSGFELGLPKTRKIRPWD